MDQPKYMIGVAAQMVGMHPQTLRLYEARGLVAPRRTPGGTRLYSDRDIARLHRIQRLSSELGLSLVGVEHVLLLEDSVSALRDRVARLEARLDAQVVEAARAVEAVHRSYRREVVVYRPPSQELELRPGPRSSRTSTSTGD
jgi:MerR family transcriptional regulator/heat shock protein HspR